MLDSPLSGPRQFDQSHSPEHVYFQVKSPHSECDGSDGSSLLLDDHKELFRKQAREVRQQVQHDICSVTSNRVDLLEVCCPWDSPLSAAVVRAGGRAFRMGIHNGHDLSTKAGVAKAIRKFKELRPRYLHVSPPCFPWSTATNGALGNATMLAKLQQNRQHGRKILKGCAKLVEIQRQELRGQTSMCPDSSAGHAGGEHPLCALSWREPSMRRMVSLCGGEKFRVDGCRFGMYSERGQVPFRSLGGGSLRHRRFGRPFRKGVSVIGVNMCP